MKKLVLAFILSLFAVVPALADEVTDRVAALAETWSHVNYEVPESRRLAEMEALADRADALVAQYPNRAEPLVWDGIITATAGGLKGGLGGLALAREAKEHLERAERINPNVLDGSVYTSLGSLYAQVPGFPVGFGNNGKAREYLQRALRANPNGIDPNYFMGDFLIRQRDFDGAIAALERALAAPDRPGRQIADRGRRQEARELLEEARRRAR